jgi:outer membrane protein insertion porin family
VSLGYNAFYRSTDYDDLDVDVASYAVDSLRCRRQPGLPDQRDLAPDLRPDRAAGQDQDRQYTVDEIFDFIEQEGDNFLNFKASIGWSESTLNKGVLATRGHSQSLTLETTVPGSDLSFYKLDYRGQLFQPITSDYTLRLHTELGYGDGRQHLGLPFYENYYAGGFNSVRGFKDSSLGRAVPEPARPHGQPGTIADPDQDPLPFGGNVLVQGGRTAVPAAVRQGPAFPAHLGVLGRG